MSIILFALIGAAIHGGTAYWICFSFYCLFAVVKVIMKVKEES